MDTVMSAIVKLIIGLAGSGAVALYARRKSSLSTSGAWAATAMGTGFFALGTPFWYGALLVFFGTSTFWSRWKRKSRAKEQAEGNYAKGSRRDAGQVWANGGAGLALCAVYAFWPEPLAAAAFVGVMASVNADTWATEIGALSRTAPRSVLTGRRVPPGTSGGVTLLGTAAALAGAAAIGAAFALLPGREAAGLAPGALVAVAALAGLAGAFADSLLGATVQAMYRCPGCGAETERAVHCGRKTALVRGSRLLTNDLVNLLSSLLAGIMAVVIALLLR